jgi:hypothetical protein
VREFRAVANSRRGVGLPSFTGGRRSRWH